MSGEPNLHRLAHERETGDPQEDHLRRLARRIVSRQKAEQAKKTEGFQLARDRAREEVDEAWHAQT